MMCCWKGGSVLAFLVRYCRVINGCQKKLKSANDVEGNKQFVLVGIIRRFLKFLLLLLFFVQFESITE
jgi:hypothetical protein